MLVVDDRNYIDVPLSGTIQSIVRICRNNGTLDVRKWYSNKEKTELIPKKWGLALNYSDALKVANAMIALLSSNSDNK